MSSSQEGTLSLSAVTSHPRPHWYTQWLPTSTPFIQFLSVRICLFWALRIRGITHDVGFCVCLLSLGMFSRFIHMVPGVRASFLSIAKLPFSRGLHTSQIGQSLPKKPHWVQVPSGCLIHPMLYHKQPISLGITLKVLQRGSVGPARPGMLPTGLAPTLAWFCQPRSMWCPGKTWTKEVPSRTVETRPCPDDPFVV